MDHAQHGADRELAADLEPRLELLPCPAVHPHFPSLATLPTPDEHRAPASVKIALLKGERFADSEPGAPEQHDQRREAVAVGMIARDHPELVAHLEAVMETVANPDHIEPDSIPARTRFYRRGAGPGRWLVALVSYEQEPARIITALINRRDPERWKP